MSRSGRHDSRILPDRASASVSDVQAQRAATVGWPAVTLCRFAVLSGVGGILTRFERCVLAFRPEWGGCRRARARGYLHGNCRHDKQLLRELGGPFSGSELSSS